ncbi:MAG: hypothetical protein DYG98_16415 [Haliscomenobacteraceae bacterium CHB4]|nr:hypothetical protein [Haliscomenobacteraceae bacterium CHB4]
MENEVFKVDSSYRDAFWDYANAFIRTNIQDLDGLRQVSVQVWGNSKEYFNQVYHLKGETTFEVYEEWEYEKTTGNFELRFIVEDIRGENVVKKRRISVME